MTITTKYSRRAFGALLLGTTAACASTIPESMPEIPRAMPFLEGYEPIFDAGYNLPGIPRELTQGVNRRMTGIYLGEAPPNSIDVDPYAKFLYHVKDDAQSQKFTGRSAAVFRVDCATRWGRVRSICSAMGATHITGFTAPMIWALSGTRAVPGASGCSIRTSSSFTKKSNSAPRCGCVTRRNRSAWIRKTMGAASSCPQSRSIQRIFTVKRRWPMTGHPIMTRLTPTCRSSPPTSHYKTFARPAPIGAGLFTSMPFTCRIFCA